MNILYATDGSRGALAGAQTLCRLPLPPGSRIRLLAVAEENNRDDPDGAFALEITGRALAGIEATVTTETRRAKYPSEVLDAILRAAEQPDDAGQHADLLVLGTRGRSPVARFFLGSVAARVARYAPCPVLVARPLRGGELDQVVLGSDGSPGSQAAAEFIKRAFPLPSGATVHLATFTPPTTTLTASHLLLSPVIQDAWATLEQSRREHRDRLVALAGDFGRAGRLATSTVRADDPAGGLLSLADEHRADLLVVGSQGLGAADRFLLGSVSEKVLRHAPCSVLVFRSRAPETDNADNVTEDMAKEARS